MRSIKKLTALLGALMLLCLLPLSAQAAVDDEVLDRQLRSQASDGYYIENYHIDATLHKNNTVTQTETIKVNFLSSKHGIFRAFPKNVRVLQQVDGKNVNMSYSVRITDAKVEGEPYTDYSENDVYYIKIGDADSLVSGEHTYTISFTYDIGDDRVPDYDMLFYSLNGPDWDCPIGRLTATVKFEKPLPVNTVRLYYGRYGSTQFEELPVVNNTVTVDTANISAITEGVGMLTAGKGVTLFSRLPEGYFTGERTYGKGVYPTLVLLFLALVGSVIFRIKHRRRQVVQTVEFYPPDGVSSAEVGYIIDGVVDDKDVLSLIIWFADKGYLTISEQEKKHMVLHKEKEADSKWPSYMKTMYKGLFADGTDCDLKNVDKDFAEKFIKTKEKVPDVFSGKRTLQKFGWLGMLLAVVCAGLEFLLLMACNSGIMELGFVMSMIPAVALFIVGFIAAAAARRWRFDRVPRRAIYVIVIAAISAFCCIIAYITARSGAVNPLYALIGTIVLIVACLICATAGVETEYSAEMGGKLLGFREFIKTAELPKLEQLVEEDPSYFYHVLPYAYVFGLTDKWIKRFENIKMPQPTWYSGYSGNMFSMLAFNHIMTSNLSRAVSQVHTMTAQSGSGGSFGGGGGGFSGGGFGGGGGGSW